MAAIEWPPLLRFAGVKWWREAGLRSGGRALSGDEQLAVTDGGGRWRARLPLKLISTPNEIRTYRAVVEQMEFGTVPVVLPVIDTPQQPFPGAIDDLEGGIPYSDGALHSDLSGFVNGSIVARLNAGAALRATTVEIEQQAMASLKGGEYFTLAHAEAGPRLYLVKRITDISGDVRTVEIVPPLREAVSSGEPADFGEPRCLMRLTNPGEGAALDFGTEWFARPTLEFVEPPPGLAG